MVENKCIRPKITKMVLYNEIEYEKPLQNPWFFKGFYDSVLFLKEEKQICSALFFERSKNEPIKLTT